MFFFVYSVLCLLVFCVIAVPCGLVDTIGLYTWNVIMMSTNDILSTFNILVPGISGRFQRTGKIKTALATL